MEGCLDELRDNICIPYLDDIIVFSKTFEEHVDNVRTVLRRLGAYGVKLKATKCKLFQREVCYLGRMVSDNGYQDGSKNVNAVKSLKKKATEINWRSKKVIWTSWLLPSLFS